MEERNVKVTLLKAKEWYNSNNEILKKIALQAFSEEELKSSFTLITSFKKACNSLGIDYDKINTYIDKIKEVSKASAAITKLIIIREALNLGQELYLTKNPKDSYIWFPANPFITKTSTYYKDALDSGEMEVIGKIKSEGIVYDVLGNSALICTNTGLSCFYSTSGVGYANTDIGLLGCANKKIAKHFGKYFGMLITEAKYGNLPNFEILKTFNNY